MNLLLTSQGTVNPKIMEELLRLNGKSPRNTKLLFINTAAKAANNRYMPGEIERLIKTGFNLSEFDIAEHSQKEVAKAIADNDIIFIIGGQPFYLLKVIRKSGFESSLKKLSGNKLYVGASAGSYAACPSTEMGLWKKPERDTYGLTDLSGMSLVDFLVFAHYEDKYKELLETKRKQIPLKIYELTDKQAISIDHGHVKLVE